MSEQSASISLAPEESLKLAQVASIDNFDQPSSAGHFPTVSAGEDNIQEVAAQCFLRMEDDDDSSHDLLATMDAELAFGNIYCGHKQIKRFWLINESDMLSISVAISTGHSDEARTLVGEIGIDGTGLLLPGDEQPARGACVESYLEQHSPPAESSVCAEAAPSALLLEAAAASASAGAPDSVRAEGKRLEVGSSSSAQPGAALVPDARATKPAAASDAPAAQAAQTQMSTPSSSAVMQTAAKPARKAAAGGAAGTKERAQASQRPPAGQFGGGGGSNLTTDADFGSVVSWEHLRESSGGLGSGSTKVRRGSSAGSSSGSTAVLLGFAKGGQRLTVSSLCGRQWGQDGVTAELCGIDCLAEGGDGDYYEGGGPGEALLQERRPFIGATAKAVRLSRANKSFAKLHGARRSALGDADVSTPTAPLPAAAANTASSTSLASAGDGGGDATGGGDAVNASDVAASAPGHKVDATLPLLRLEADELFSAVLKPLERLQITVLVTPSAEYVHASTGGRVGAELVPREIPLLLRWAAVDDSAAGDAGAPPRAAQCSRVKVRFQCCQSLISVTPEDTYDLGMCNVGEQRTLVLDVANRSQMPALVFPLVQSEVLDVTELRELHIPALETVQLRVSYLAKVEQAEYWDRVILLNAYNSADHKEVKVKARNLDTEQILLHSMFYKLVTYNSMRQLQVSFSRCLINMPNLRVFSVKNVHSRPLCMHFSWNRKLGLRLFVVVTQTAAPVASPVPAVASAPSAMSVGAPEDGRPAAATSKAAVDDGSVLAAVTVANKPGKGAAVLSSDQQDDIEDMKWGESALDFASAGGPGGANLSKSLNRQNFKRSMSMYSKSGVGSVGGGGDDGAVNYGKGSVTESKASNLTSSSDILSVLDLSQSSGVLPQQAPPSVSLPAELPTEDAAATSPAPRAPDPAPREVRFTDSPHAQSEPHPVEPPKSASSSVAARALKAASTKSESAQSVASVQSQPAASSARVLDQFDREDFPFCLVEEGGAGDQHDHEGIVAKQHKAAAEGSDDKKSTKAGKSVRSGDDSGRPHSLGGSVYAGSSGSGAGSGDANASASKDRARSELEVQIKKLQKAYSELKAVIDAAGQAEGSCLVELAAVEADSPDRVAALVELPLGATLKFAVVFEPQQREEFEDPDEYTQVKVSDALHIQLPTVDAAEVNAIVERVNKDSSSTSSGQVHVGDDPHLLDEPHGLPAGGLRPRTLPIRAVLVRSEMVVIQKNINFGRTVLNDKSSRGVTVVNRSSVPCVYTISKSGSISSGFLQVPSGRKGLIPPFSSKVIQFIFKPSMAGNFEEVLMISNVLNPRDAQAVTIKAKVHHTETFVLSAAAAPPGGEAADESPVPAAGEHSLALTEASEQSRLLEHLAAAANAPFANNVKGLMHFLGACAVGGDSGGVPSSYEVSFRVKNVTSKPRQFIVDATHAHAIELFVGPPPAPVAQGAHMDATQNKGDAGISVVSPASPDKLISTTSFEPIPEVLQGVLCLRCRFDSEVLRPAKSASSADGAAENALSADERKTLEDSLEQFQQKLKIAIRKNKAEKIEKYQKKIDKVIAALQDNKAHTAVVVAEITGDAPEKGADADGAATRAGPEPAMPPAPELKSVHSLSEESEVSYHFQLEPEQERVVRVKLSFLPGAAYRSWPGLLPFHGYLRIFECKNEDHIKVVHFGAMVRTGRLSVASAVPFSRAEDGGNDTVPPFESPVESSEGLAGFARLEKGAPGEVPFITTISQWSSLPTREIYPKYRQLPQSLLPMCVKLVRATKDRVMHGSFSVASLLERAGALSLTIDEDFSAKVSPDYATYNPQKHGPVVFALASAPHSHASAEHQPEELVIGESSSLAAEIGSKSAAISKKDSIVLGNLQRSSSKLKAGSKVDFSVQWRPPLDLSSLKHNPQTPSMGAMPSTPAKDESASSVPGTPSALRILGAIKVQLRIDGQLVGPPQSVPFVGVLEHHSSFSVAKHYTCEGVSVGSYRTYQVPITNTSKEEELHYLVSSEEVSKQCRSLGALEIVSGQTGIVRPGGTKQLTLLFSASSPGRFEQRLWIRSIRDSFDQKRLVVQANISVAQAKFVIFPDLEASEDGVGKYKTLDLGLIQIQAGSPDEQVDALMPSNADSRCFYELRIQNVSGKPLSVTAVSNLKSQCYIYCDEECTQLAVYTPLPTSALTTLYVKIRPSAVRTVAEQAQAPEAGDAGSAAENEEKAAAKKASSSSGASGGSSSSTRELMGGVKLVFFAADASTALASAEPLKTAEEDGAVTESSAAVATATDLTPRKLFESAISFKATVGKSTLKLSSGPSSSLQHVRPTRPPGAEGQNAFVCRFELRNASKIFPLDYAYILRAQDACVAPGTDASIPADEELGKADLRLFIADGATGRLQPEESRWVSCTVQCGAGSSGLVVCPIRVLNVSTREVSSLSLTTFVDPGYLRSSEIDERDEPPALAGAQQVPSAELVQAAGPLTTRRSSTCVWAYRSTAEIAARVADALHAAGPTASSSADDADPAPVAEIAEATEGFVVQGSFPAEICSWVVTNTRKTPISLFPVSDLPVTVVFASIEPAAASALPSAGSEKMSDAPGKAQVGSADSYSSKISPALLRWRDSLLRCGATVSLPAGASALVSVTAKRGAAMQGKAAKLESGRVTQLSGVVVFLQASHSLQSLFDPARKEGASSASGEKTSAGDAAESRAQREQWNAEHFDVIPVVGVTRVSCDIASPALRLPVTQVALGRHRYGSDATFQFSVENPCDVDVPVCLDDLPDWMAIEKFAISAIAPGPSDTGEGLSLGWNKSGGAAKSARSIGAQKLHWWIATNGATISDQSGRTAPATDGSTTPRRRGSRESNISFEDWQRALSDTASNGEPASAGSAHNPGEDEEVHDPAAETDLPAEETANEQYHGELALDVHDQELFRQRKAAVAGADSGRPGPSSATAVKVFGIPAQSRIHLVMQVKVPVTESQVVRHVLKVKNLATGLVSGAGVGSEKYLFDRQGGVMVADEHQLQVTMQIDATRALELIPAIDEPLLPRSQLEGAAASPSPTVVTGAAPVVRILKDPFVIPPAVEVTPIEGAESAEAVNGEPVLIQAKSKIAKTHCRFSIKNKLPESVRVRATVDINPEVADLLHVKVKFQTNNADEIELMPEESSAVKVRVVPLLSGRLSGARMATSLVVRTAADPRAPTQGASPASADAAAEIQPLGEGVPLAGSASAPVPSIARTLSRGASSFSSLAQTQQAPQLLGTIYLTPQLSGHAADGDSVADSIRQMDTITIDLIGHLRSGPTITTLVAAPSAPIASVSSEAPLPILTSGSAAPAPVPAGAPQVLEFRAAPVAPADRPSAAEEATGVESASVWEVSGSGKLRAYTGGASPLAAALQLTRKTQSFYVVNPSSSCPVNFEIRTQEYRHAGLSLLLPPAGPGDGAHEESYDTFTVLPSPTSGCLPPSTMACITLRLVAGDPARASKAGATLTSDIPDVQMRERRLRSHHKDPLAGPGVIPSGSAASKLGGISSAGIASMSQDSPAGSEVAPPASSLPPLGGVATALSASVLSSKAAAAGPYTIACMPLEVWDTDHPAHPPRVLCAYLTSEVALAVISTQSVRESADARNPSGSARKGAPRAPPDTAEARFASIAVDVPAEKEEAGLRTPAVGPQNSKSSAAAAEVTVQLGGDSEVRKASHRLIVLEAGAQTQRKESLEWMVGVENASAGDMLYSVTPMVAQDTEVWLGLGQSGGVLRAGELASFAVYARRTIALGTYISYIQVRNRADPADCAVLKVCMEVVAEAKRAPPLPSVSSAVPRIASNSAENLASLDAPQTQSSTSADAQESLLLVASGGAAERGSGRASPLTASASALSLEAVGRPPSASLAAASRDAEVFAATAGNSTAIQDKSDSVTATSAGCKALYQLCVSNPSGSNGSAADGSMSTFSGEDLESSAPPAIGLSLSPLPSPSENVRKRITGAVVQQQRAQFAVTSLADVPLQLSALAACCRADLALVVAVCEQSTGTPSPAAASALLQARGSLTLVVEAMRSGRALSGADLALQLAAPRSCGEARDERPGLLGQVLVTTPLVPDQVQAVDVLLREGLDLDS